MPEGCDGSCVNAVSVTIDVTIDVTRAFGTVKHSNPEGGTASSSSSSCCASVSA